MNWQSIETILSSIALPLARMLLSLQHRHNDWASKSQKFLMKPDNAAINRKENAYEHTWNILTSTRYVYTHLHVMYASYMSTEISLLLIRI